MTEKAGNFFMEYIDTLLLGSEEKNVLFMQHNNALNISEEDVQKLPITERGYHVIYHSFQYSEMRKPYEPFLDVICDYLKKKQRLDSAFSMEHFFEQAEVYPAHRQIFESYFQNESCERREEMIIGEYQYEKKKFQNAVLHMLKIMAEEHPVFLLLNEVNCAGSSLLWILEEILKQDAYNCIKVMAVCNEEGERLFFAEKAFWNFIETCEEFDVVCNWIFETMEVGKTENLIATEIKMGSISEYIPNLNNMFYTLEFEQAAYYLKRIFGWMEQENMKMDLLEKNKLLQFYCWISLEKEEYSYALFLCEMAEQLKFENQEMQQTVRFQTEYLKTLAHLYNGNQTQVVEGVSICETLAEQIGEDKHLFHAELLKNMSEYLGWKNLWICENDTEVKDTLIQQCIRYGYENHLAHIYVYSFNGDYHNFTTIEGIEERILEFNKGIALGEKLQNEQFLIEAYQKNVMLASIHGYFPVCIYFYKKTLDIVRRSKDELKEAGIYNGLGYSNCGLEHYEEANEYYNKALILYYKYSRTDDVVETLYNLGINAILAEDYNNASAYLLEASNTLRILKKGTLRMCNISKLYGLIALSCFRQGIMYRAYLYLNSAKQFLAYILGTEEEEKEYFVDDSMFLVYLVDGLLKHREKSYDDVIKDFNKAEFYMKRSTGAMFFNYPQFAIAKYTVFMELGKEEEAKAVLVECREYCRNNHFLYREQKINALLGEEKPEQAKIAFSKMRLENISLRDIAAMVRKVCIKKEKNDMIKSIHFFNTLQKFTNHMTGTIKEGVANVMPAFKNNFDINKALIIRCTQEGRDIIYSDLGFEVSEDMVRYIVEYFYDNPRGFVTSKNGVEHEEYDKLISLFDKARIFSFAAVPIFEEEWLRSIFIVYIEMKDSWTAKERSILSQEDLDVFIYIFRQISNTLDSMEAQEKLECANLQLKERMDQVIALKDEAEAANEAKSNFLANMSHEIRTPMNAIIGMAEIAMRGEMKKEQKEVIAQIQSAANSLLSIINDILDFSKIEAGKMEIREDNYHLSNVLQDIKNILSVRIGEKALQLKILVNQDIPMYLYGDDVRIRQIILNLGNNAVKFTEKGSITITVDYEPDGENILLKISVQDTGIGIKPEDQKKLFSSFQQVDGKRNRKIEGTGLGLSISKALVTLMGGSISVTSTYGEGSTFSFEIPQKVIETLEMEEMEERRECENYIAPKARVLIVDDNQMNLKVAEGLLQPLQMQIDLAGSGFQAIEMLQETPCYDIVFMDHMMPELDGIEATGKIRELEGSYYKKLPIIALTANAVSGVREMFLENGMDDFLPKPIDMKQMNKILQKWLPKDKICKTDDVVRETAESEFPDIEGLDVEKAVQFSGTIDIFMKLLQVFYDTLPAKVDSIEKYEQEENIHNYTIEVHALKSASRLIGAMELSKQAEYLEACGKEENIREIHEKTPQLLDLYRSYIEYLRPHVQVKENKEKKMLDSKVLKEELELLLQYLADFNIDGADAVMEELSEYEFEEKFMSVFEPLKELIENVVYDEAEELIRNYMQ